MTLLKIFSLVFSPMIVFVALLLIIICLSSYQDKNLASFLIIPYIAGSGGSFFQTDVSYPG
jgi:ABC-type multidrug transport system permease subunit